MQLAVDLLSDLADGVQEVTSDYNGAIEGAGDTSITEDDESKRPATLFAKSNMLFSEYAIFGFLCGCADGW